jgi:hypothetical protein
MKHVTKRVKPEAVRDLLDRVPRATLAFNDHDAVAALPVAFRFHGGRYWVGLSRSTTAPQPAAPVTLVIDEGWYWFDLRGIYLRGNIAPAEPPPGGASTLDWFELTPVMVSAWEYATLHEEDPDAS